MTKKQFDLSGFKKILANNRKTATERLYNETMKRALIAKYGHRVGLLCSNRVTNEEYEVVSEAMRPIINEIQEQATLSFARVFNDMLEDDGCREYLLSKAGKANGGKGGRPPGGKEKYLQWLEAVMIRNAKKCIDRNLRAKEHFQELLAHPDTDGVGDRGDILFRRSALERMGYDPDRNPPTVTLNAITKALTRINNGTKNQ